jgi:hypothetical protein
MMSLVTRIYRQHAVEMVRKTLSRTPICMRNIIQNSFTAWQTNHHVSMPSRSLSIRSLVLIPEKVRYQQLCRPCQYLCWTKSLFHSSRITHACIKHKNAESPSLSASDTLDKDLRELATLERKQDSMRCDQSRHAPA